MGCRWRTLTAPVLLTALVVGGCANRVMDDEAASRSAGDEFTSAGEAPPIELDPQPETPAVPGPDPAVGGDSAGGTGAAGPAEVSRPAAPRAAASATPRVPSGPQASSGGQSAPGANPAAEAPAGPAPTGPAGTPEKERRTLVVGSVDTRSGPVNACHGGWEGISSFIGEANARGGVNGYRFKLIGYDDGLDPNRNAAAVKQLIERDKVDVMVGMCSDLTIYGGAPLAEKAGLPVIGFAGASLVPYQIANFFPTSAPQQPGYPKFMVEFSKRSLACQRVGLLYVNVPEGQGGARYIRQYSRQAGMEVVSDSAFSLTEPDFTSFVVKLKQAGAQCVAMIGVADHLIRFMKAAEQQRFEGQVVGPLPVYDPAIPRAVGDYVKDRLYAVVNHSALETSDPGAVSAYLGALKKYYPSLVSNTYSIDGWMAGEAFAEGLRRLEAQPFSSEAMLAALRTFKDWQGSFNPPVTYGPGPNTLPARCDAILRVNPDATFTPVGERFLCTDQF